MESYGRFAKIYDPLMCDVDYDEWAAYLRSFLPAQTRQIAECACGTGEITLRLSRMGYEVTGIDKSKDMLEVAQEKARKAGKRIPFIWQDMQALTLHHPVDAVIAACDGVNYLDSLKAVANFIRSANAALKAGGMLLFDISSRYKIEILLGEKTFAEDDGAHAYIWKNNYDPDSRRICMELSFFNRVGELYERFEETHIQRAHSSQEIMKLLRAGGFDAEVYEAFTRCPAGDQSERLQFVAKKKE